MSVAKELNRLIRIRKQINEYDMNMLGVMTRFELNQYLGKLVLINSFDYVASQLRIGKDETTINRVLLDTKFKKKMASDFGHNDNSNVRKYLVKLVELGLMNKTDRKDEYFINPLIKYRGHLKFYIEALAAFYEKKDNQKGRVYELFEKKYDNIEQLSKDLKSYSDIQNGTGEKPTRPDQIADI